MRCLVLLTPNAFAGGMQRPDPNDHAPFFQSYVDRVPDGDVLAHLERQGRATCTLLAGIGEAKGAFAYADGKWTVKRLLQHVVDGERLFVYRAMCIARGDTQNLPSFDENGYAAHDGSDGRLLADVIAEYAAVRVATILFFRGLDAVAWTRRGTANGKPLAVRSLPWITAGHELHHLTVLRERYGVG
jgi:hypothetical protein